MATFNQIPAGQTSVALQEVTVSLGTDASNAQISPIADKPLLTYFIKPNWRRSSSILR